MSMQTLTCYYIKIAGATNYITYMALLLGYKISHHLGLLFYNTIL